MFKLNPFTGEFDQVGGILVESLPTNFLAGSVIFSNGSTLAQDNANFFWDNASNFLKLNELRFDDLKGVKFGDSQDSSWIWNGSQMQISGITLWDDDVFIDEFTDLGAVLNVNPASSTDIGIAIQLAASATADAIQILNNALGELFAVDPSGNTDIAGTLTSGTHTISAGLILASGSITDLGGTITFGNENLDTTGTFASGKATISAAGIALDVQNTTDAASNQVAIFKSGNRATPADQDEGYFSFMGDNNLGTQVETVRFTWRFNDVTSTSKDSSFEYHIWKTNAFRNVFKITSATVVFNEDSVNEDFRIESNSNPNMFKVDAGVDEIFIGHATALGAALSIIAHATTDVGLIVKEKASQTGDIAQFLTSNTQGISIESGANITNGDIIINNTSSSGDVNYDAGAQARYGTVTADAVAIGRSTLNTRIVGDLEIDEDLNHDGTVIGFFGTTPAVQVSAYTPINVFVDRAYDANATTVDELADVLGTLIADLQTYGLLQ